MRPGDGSGQLRQLADVARSILRLRAEHSGRSVVENEWPWLALLHLIQTIGECVGRLDRLDPAWRESAPGVDWDKVVNTRHRLVHAYDNIDPDVILRIADSSVPELLAAIEPLLKDPP
jgi:uncharacterized protein with HEPN domain